MIKGVYLKPLESYQDERGFFREIIKVSDEFFEEEFGQWSHSLLYPGVIKAWHIHRKQTDWWYVINGTLKVVLYDKRPDSETSAQMMDFFMGDNQTVQVLKIPPGVAHGCKCISGPSNLFYITSCTYDPEDEGRIPHDDPEIGYDWLEGPPIK